MQEYARRLKGKGVDSFACHPGIAQTPLYEKTDKGKPEGVGVDLLQKVRTRQLLYNYAALVVCMSVYAGFWS